MQTKERIPAEIWVLVAAAFLIALGFGFVAPILPQFAASFDVGVMAAAAIVSVFAFVRLIFAPAGGSLVDKFGERSVYLVGLSINALSTALCGFATTYWQLIAFRAIGGIGSVLFTVSSMALLVKLSPVTQRGKTASLYGTAFLLGNIFGPVLGSALAGFGLRVPFFIYASTVAVAIVVVLIFLRGKAGGRPKSADSRPRMTLKEALAHPYYRALLLTAFANGWANFGVRIALIPLMAAAVPTIGAGWAGIALTLFAIGSAVTQQLTGRLVDKKGRRPFLVLGLAVSALATALFGWGESVGWFLGLSVLAGVGAALLAPASQALLADLIGNDRQGGQALSTFSMATDLGSIAGTMLAGYIADALGFGWAFAATGIVLAVAVLPWLFVKRRPAHR